MPLLGNTDPNVKVKLVAAVKARKWEDIPSEFYTRLGYNSNGLWVGDDEAFANHPVKKIIDKEKAEKKRVEEERKAKEGKIHLSTRGWGDFDSVIWIGNITQSDDIILAECRTLLNNNFDVDHKNQTDAEILEKISKARAKHSESKKKYKPIEHGPGYCYSCESYCYGDCGDYQPTYTMKVLRRDVRNMNDEASFGIQD